MNGPTQRILVVAFAVVLLLLGGTAAFLYARRQPPPPSITRNEADDANAANPYVAEMGCIDRVLQRNDMDANQVQPALENCRASGSETNRTAGQ